MFYLFRDKLVDCYSKNFWMGFQYPHFHIMKKNIGYIILAVIVAIAAVGYFRLKNFQKTTFCAREVKIDHSDPGESTYSFPNLEKGNKSFKTFDEAIEYCKQTL